MAILDWEILHRLQDHGDGVSGTGWKEGSSMRHEHLPSQGGFITEDGGSPSESKIEVGSIMLHYFLGSYRSQAVVPGGYPSNFT